MMTGQACTVYDGVAVDFLHPLRDVHTLQTCASAEGTRTAFRHALRNCDAGQTRAAEGSILFFLHTFRNCHASQLFDAVEGLVSN